MDENSALINRPSSPPTLIFDNSSNINDNIIVYRRRWFMLLVLALLNLSSGMIWMSFGNIADVTSLYYSATTLQVNWLSIVFMMATLILGFPGIWLLDRYGLRATFFTAAILNTIGTVVRMTSLMDCFHGHQKDAYSLLLIGQVLAGCSQPFILFSSTKLAAAWFPSHQRTLANMVASTANPIGILCGSLVSTMVVSEDRDLQIIRHQLLILLAIPTCLSIVTLISTLFVTTPIPPTPPSFSASEEVHEFWAGLRKLFTNKDYLLLATTYGSGVGLISSLITIVDQLLLPFGYSDKFSALITCLLFSCGLLGAFAFSTAADRLLRHEEMAKVSYSFGSSFLIIFVVLTHFSNLEVYLALIISAAGIFCLALNPLCLELSVETSFPVSEGTSGGLLVLFGQVMSCIYTFLLSIIPNNTLNHNQDIISKHAMLGFLLVTFLSDVIFVILFKCPYVRRQLEEKKEAERVMSRMRHPEELLTPTT